MSVLTGEIGATLGNTSYRLILGLRGIAQLQREYGNGLQGIMGSPPQEGGEEGAALPDFNAYMDVVKVSLQRFHSQAADDLDIVEGLLSQDWSLPGRLIAAAFPDAEEKPAAGKRKARG